MTEEEARAALTEQFGDTRMGLLARFADLVREEATRQNLVSPATLGEIWNRHVLDSAQLVPWAPSTGVWVDIGTGAGFPGLIVAVLRDERTVLVEPRRLRAAFLERAADALMLPHVEVVTARIENVEVSAAVISARAVAPVEKLLHAAAGCATTATRWLLPRGRSADADLALLRQRWAGEFHVKQSVTDPDSSVLVLDGVTAKKDRRR